MSLSPAQRQRIVEVARSLVGVPYVWGGTTRAGADCSGAVQIALAEAGLEPWATQFPRRRRDTCRTMWDQWEPTEAPEPGDVAIYDWGHDGTRDHVVLVTEVREGVVWEVVGSTRGRPTITTAAHARAVHATVVRRGRRNAHMYRVDFVGWRRPIVTARVG